MEFENVLLDKNDNVAIITINRPKQLNALNKDTISDLNKALLNLEDDKNIKSIIITGSGEKAFVAGADIKEFAHFGVLQGKELARSGQEKLFDFIENFSKPIIAINGCLGGNRTCHGLSFSNCI